MKITLREWVGKMPATFDMIGIIDDWEKCHHGYLPVAEAVEKFGDMIVEGSAYGGELSRYTKPNGKHPTAWDLWIDIPGMHLGSISSDRLTIPNARYDKDLKVSYVMFKGKKSGENITVVRNGNDPYEVYFRSTGFIEYVTDCGKNPHYVWHGKKLAGDTEAVIWILRDEVWEHYDKEEWK